MKNTIHITDTIKRIIAIVLLATVILVAVSIVHVTADRSDKLRLSAVPVLAESVEHAGAPCYVVTAETDTDGDIALDWTVEFPDGFGSTVAAPVIVTVSPDDVRTATVTCVAVFQGIATVRATVRGTDISATCTCEFIGVPTSLGITSTDMQFDGEYYTPSIGTYTVELDLDNYFHTVGAEYGDYTMTYSRQGSVLALVQDNYVVNIDGSPVQTNKTVTFASLSNYFSSSISFPVLLPYMKIAMSENVLTIAVNRTLSEYSDTSGTFTAYSVLNVIEVVSPCYVLITVTDNVSGLSTSIKVLAPF